MFFIIGLVFLALLGITLVMLWNHEKLNIKKITPHAHIEEYWKGEERRLHVRLQHNIDVEYKVEKEPHLKLGKGCDISEGGMKILLDEKLPKGSIIDLKLVIPESGKTIELEGEIIWTKDAPEIKDDGKRHFYSGMRFVGIRQPHELLLSQYLDVISPLNKEA